MQPTTNNAAPAPAYPKETTDGFFFEDDTNETMGIESQTYENGNEVRRVTLSDKRVAMVRQLTGAEMGKNVNRLTGDNKENYQFALVAVSTKINDIAPTLEDVMEMRGKDYIKLQVASSQLNF